MFTLSSLACAAAPSQGALIAARFVQGVGGALSSAVVLGMIFTMFPEPRDLAKAIGVYGFVASAGGSIGLLLGGVLTDAISWHWIFFINVPIGVVTAILARRLVPDKEGLGLGAGIDVPGAFLITSSLMIGTYTILEGSRNGWGSLTTLGLAALSLVLGAAFLVRQDRIPNPLMPLRLFSNRAASVANAVLGMLVAGMFAQFFLGALYMQGILGYTPLDVGLAFLPSCVVMGAMSLRVSDRMILRVGARNALIPSQVCIAIALLLLARTPIDGDYVVDILPAMILFGLGAGIGFPALMSLAMAGATPRASSTPPCRSAARSAWRSWPRWPTSARTACAPAARARTRRSTAATTWPTSSRPASC